MGGPGPEMTVDGITVNPADITPPSAVNNLVATTPVGINGAVHLSWTAPGNDGTVGTATSYLVRYSSSAIALESDWTAATPVASGIPVPPGPGTSQSMNVTGLTPA